MQRLIACLPRQHPTKLTPRVTNNWEKKLPKFSKNSPKSHQVKKCQNIYNKAQFENSKHPHQTTFETLKYLQHNMF
jgi:hypothetical protein